MAVIDELGIRLLGPAARGLVLFAGEYAHRDWDRDAFGVEKAAFVFPVETRRGERRIREPVERNVVENLVSREFAGGASRPAKRGIYCCRRLAIGIIVVKQPSRETNWRIRYALYRLRARSHQAGVRYLLEGSF